MKIPSGSQLLDMAGWLKTENYLEIAALLEAIAEGRLVLVVPADRIPEH